MKVVAVLRAKPWLAYVGVVIALAGLRLCWLNAYPLNSDEAQHAHVAWAWTQQLLPYRDVFDNHGPLFSLLYSYTLKVIGERLHVLTWLRLAVQPWYALSLLSVWWMGRRLYGSRIALAAVPIAGLFPRFFLVSGQFRTDDMWAALWLASLAAIVGAPWTRWRWLLAGLMAGAALSVSQKTIVLLATALIAAACVHIADQRSSRTLYGRCLLAGLIGFMAIPLSCGIWLYLHHDLASAWYGLARYNMQTAGAAEPGDHTYFRLKLALFIALLCGGLPAVLAWLKRSNASENAPTAFLALHSCLFLLTIFLIWPLVTRQDPLPVLPLLIISMCGLVARQSQIAFTTSHKLCMLAGIVALEIGLIVAGSPPWVDQLAPQRAQLATVLHYTDNSDMVMDDKSGAIFRMRPYYPVIESLAVRRFKNGLAADTIRSALVERRTMLVIRGRLPPMTDAFVLHNYLAAGHNVWVAGQQVSDAANSAATRTLHVDLPGDYTLVDGTNTVAASMDDGRAATHWDISPGPHQLTMPSGGHLYLVWTQAWQRGWRPVGNVSATGS